MQMDEAEVEDPSPTPTVPEPIPYPHGSRTRTLGRDGEDHGVRAQGVGAAERHAAARGGGHVQPNDLEGAGGTAERQPERQPRGSREAAERRPRGGRGEFVPSLTCSTVGGLGRCRTC